MRGGGSDSAAPPGRPLGVVSTGRRDRWHHRLSDRPPRFVTPHLARTSNSNKLECFKTALTDFEHTPRRRRRIANVTVGSGAVFFQSRCVSCLFRMIREFFSVNGYLNLRLSRFFLFYSFIYKTNPLAKTWPSPPPTTSHHHRCT